MTKYRFSRPDHDTFHIIDDENKKEMVYSCSEREGERIEKLLLWMGLTMELNYKDELKKKYAQFNTREVEK